MRQGLPLARDAGHIVVSGAPGVVLPARGPEPGAPTSPPLIVPWNDTHVAR